METVLYTTPFLLQLILVYVAVNILLTELAHKWLGLEWLWLLGFLFLPGISHVVFIYVLILKWHKQRALKVVQSITCTTDGLTPDGQLLVDVDKQTDSVTPFDNDVDEKIDDKDADDGVDKDNDADDRETPDAEIQTGSVTPFDSLQEKSEKTSSDDVSNILDEIRDEKIDKLMEFNEWANAYFQVNIQLEKAREKDDQKLIRLYEAYSELIEPNLPLTDNLPPNR